MSDIVCQSCGHGPHRDKTCAHCPCAAFIRPDVALTNVAVNVFNTQAVIAEILADMKDLFGEIYPDAAARLKAKRETEQKLKDAVEHKRRFVADQENQRNGDSTTPATPTTGADGELGSTTDPAPSSPASSDSAPDDPARD